ncbi:VCBS repeat-containing protein [Gelidibacter salicanalis]|uniref:VCBS repeat-containing protein n=1 Tax=Gelidibacter salicanalis TaxID=291193 RepID=A0A934KYT9_9FLAO|nr:VCBS repeat-containing protein [Gelidibacter salicanalis]MBJ7882998.1 VCBS repeat-containing protein [Gelidibacter salicanalis]
MNNFRIIKVLIICVLLGCISCDNGKKNTINKDEKIDAPKLFQAITPEHSGVDFYNQLIESEDFHYYKYIYSYNGGGVAAADFNTDGLVDLYFTSNQGNNKLYINKGDFKFEDGSATAGFKPNVGFNSGVAIADVNNDGFPDIYVCKAGSFDDERLTNELYINNGDLTFTERAAEYGLADTNRSTTATFFDYDKDGFIDLYITNTPVITKDYREIKNLIALQSEPETLALKGSDKLYRNTGIGTFVDVSNAAGILPDRAFGLNAQVSDLDDNGYLDIYVSNDFDMPDFVFLNNGDGTFSDGRNKLLKHMSFYSMGSDIADIDNDGFMDIMTLDMSPEDYIRAKTTMAMSSIPKFDEMVNNNYHHQYMHNMLQLNNGNGTYSDISQMAGVASTDWSWSVLLADFDLDGFNDIYVTNGVFRDVIDQDKTNEIKAIIRNKGTRPTDKEFLQYTQMLPQQKLSNYFFKNSGDRTFTNQSTTWVEENPTFSNGAVYADLDNDGDLDIVVNNINEPATLLKNNAIETNKGNFIQMELEGTEQNKMGVGAKIVLTFDDGQILSRELINARGYLSSVSNKIHFGLGTHQNIPKLTIAWQDGKTQEMLNVKSNQLLKIAYKNAKFSEVKTLKETPIFTKQDLKLSHTDPAFDDFQKQLLLPHKLSQTGPAIAVADINGDGLDDVFIGGAHGIEAQLLIGKAAGGFSKIATRAFAADKAGEDVSAAFFDADADGDLDLYVVSGSYEFDIDSPDLQDRLYINNGSGQFAKAIDALPLINSSGSVVVPADFDGDGDIDLFVGSRVIPGLYPYAPISYLLVNNKGKFSIETITLAPELEKVGMVTAAVWSDLDADGDLDLIVTGEWMGISVFENTHGKLAKSKKYAKLDNAKGWWNTLLVADIDNDGDMDIVAGNLGLNYKFHASTEKPLHVYTSDFDSNGVADIMLAKYYKDKQVLVRGKQCTSQQIPALNAIVPTYNDFANKSLIEIVGEDLNKALHLTAVEFKSGIFYQEQDAFNFAPFENRVQQSLINSILFEDFDADGVPDLLLAGNNYQSEIETTRADAGIGTYLKGNGKGMFVYVPNPKHGFFADTDVRDVKLMTTTRGQIILVANNNDVLTSFVYNKKE